MQVFFKLPIFGETGNEGLDDLSNISKAYKAYIERVKERIQEEPYLKKKAEENLVWINNFIATKYAKYDDIKIKMSRLDIEFNQKFYEIRWSNYVPKKLNHSVWNKPIRELKCIEFEKAPHK